MEDAKKTTAVNEPIPVDEPTFAEFKAAMIQARIQMLAPHNANALTHYIGRIYRILNVPVALAKQEQTNALLDATIGIFAYTLAMKVKNAKKAS